MELEQLSKKESVSKKKTKVNKESIETRTTTKYKERIVVSVVCFLVSQYTTFLLSQYITVQGNLNLDAIIKTKMKKKKKIFMLKILLDHKDMVDDKFRTLMAKNFYQTLQTSLAEKEHNKNGQLTIPHHIHRFYSL